jgi:pantothenate kinase
MNAISHRYSAGMYSSSTARSSVDAHHPSDVTEIHSYNTVVSSQRQELQRVSTNLLLMFVSFSAGMLLSTTWTRVYRSYLKNYFDSGTHPSYEDEEQQRRRGGEQQQQSQSQPMPDDKDESHQSVDNSNMLRKEMSRAAPKTESVVVSYAPVVEDDASKSSNTADITLRRWPWDRLKKKRSQVPINHVELSTESKPVSSSDENNSDDTRSNPICNDDVPIDAQPQCCIGSIFGMDVGGTLAKLCYFERGGDGSSEERAHFTTNPTDADNSNFSVSSSAVSSSKSFARHHDRSNTHKRRRHSMTFRIQYNSQNYPVRKNITNTGEDERVSNCSPGIGSHVVIRKSCVEHHNYESSAINSKRSDDRLNLSLDHSRTKTFPIHIRRVKSMNTLASQSVSFPRTDRENNCTSDDHTIALHRFYDFANRLDTYRAGTRDPNLSFYSKVLDGSFHFIKFETRRMIEAMDLIRAHKLHHNIHEMGGTGGGAHKFASLWQQQLGIHMKKQDELDSLVAGMQFVLTTVIGECYTFRPDQEKHALNKKKSAPDSDNHYGNYFGVDSVDEKESAAIDQATPLPLSRRDDPVIIGDASHHDKGAASVTNVNDTNKEIRPQNDELRWSRKVQRDATSTMNASTYPYLVVTIGTGVSIIRVDGPRRYERVSGSTIGGGTYLGLIRLLTDIEDFDDVLRLSEYGDPSKVDMMVGDIYGDNSDALEKLGLPSNLVASSFGKLVTKDDPAAGLKQEDLARALLLMITNNIGQVAYLNAKIFQTPHIYFVGNFLRHNNISQRRLSYAINYWSKGEMEALFLEHEGYFGALGAFLLAQDISIADITATSSNMSNTSMTVMKQETLHRRSATVSPF